MGEFLDAFREKIMALISPNEATDVQAGPDKTDGIDNLIALGVLLWVVAEADETFLPEEKEKVKEVLQLYGKISEEDMPIVLRAVEEAAISRIDLYAFTSEVGENLSFTVKVGIIENLFRVACSDGEVANAEHEAIRKIAGLFQIDHKDFINAKLKIKKEFRLDTAGL